MTRWTEADLNRAKKPATARKPPGPGHPPPPGPASRHAPETPPDDPPPQPPGPGAYGVAQYRHFQGLRFVAADVSEAVARALCAVCEQHGVRAASTGHFLTESKSH